MFQRTILAVAVAVAVAVPRVAPAQWDPANGQWGKTDPADLRVMTWNVQDGLCSTSNTKVEARNDWCALARIVASLKPDVLILQETGDNSGNGSGSGADSVSTLTTVVELFMHGGSDPFKGGATVTAFVQKYDPAYDLPHVFVSTITDGFNRNVILSRHPFADLNGDGLAVVSDVFVFADEYAPGGTGGIRGFAFAEIDLPDTDYAGNLVVGNAHLKSGSGADDKADRLLAAQNVAYYIDYLFNGAGTGIPDPNGKVRDIPAVTDILDDFTPVLWGGDMNEDENTNARKGPVEWLVNAASTGGTDGTDRDRSDSTFDAATDVFSGSRNTLGSSKLDYLHWQDSIATLRRAFVFNSSTIPAGAAPPELVGYTGGYASASGFASDHRPVIADIILPAPEPDCPADFNDDGTVNTLDFIAYLNAFNAGDLAADMDGNGTLNTIDFVIYLNFFNTGC